jgi:hypothetical protein
VRRNSSRSGWGQAPGREGRASLLALREKVAPLHAAPTTGVQLGTPRGLMLPLGAIT